MATHCLTLYCMSQIALHCTSLYCIVTQALYWDIAHSTQVLIQTIKDMHYWMVVVIDWEFSSCFQVLDSSVHASTTMLSSTWKCSTCIDKECFWSARQCRTCKIHPQTMLSSTWQCSTCIHRQCFQVLNSAIHAWRIHKLLSGTGSAVHVSTNYAFKYQTA